MKPSNYIHKTIVVLLCTLSCTLNSFAGNIVFSGAPEGSTVTLENAGKITTEPLKLNTAYPDTALVTLANRGRIVVQNEGSDTKSIIIGDVKASFTLLGSSDKNGIKVNPVKNSSTVILLGSFTDDEDSSTIEVVQQEQHVLGPRRDATAGSGAGAGAGTPVVAADTYNP